MFHCEAWTDEIIVPTWWRSFGTYKDKTVTSLWRENNKPKLLRITKNVVIRWWTIPTWSPKIKEHRVGIMQHQLVPRCVLWQFSEIPSYCWETPFAKQIDDICDYSMYLSLWECWTVPTWFSELNTSVPTAVCFFHSFVTKRYKIIAK